MYEFLLHWDSFSSIFIFLELKDKISLQSADTIFYIAVLKLRGPTRDK